MASDRLAAGIGPPDPSYIPHMALTPKQEAFCQAYLESGIASAAYRLAYSTKAKDNVVWNEASALLQHPMVSLRIKELQAELAARHEVTLDSITMQLLEDRKLAYANNSASAAIAASMALAKLHGLLTPNPLGHEPKVINIDFTRYSDEELEVLAKLDVDERAGID